MKLLWDAIGTEFGGRHELYERNYAGSHEVIRMQTLFHARGTGSLKAMEDLASRCMAEYDENGWLLDGYASGSDLSILGKI
jgi:4-hydroxyphenylacetate 3-monooxygenase